MYDDEESFGGGFRGEKELVAGSPSQRNWRGIGIALLVILSICALITIAVVILTPSGKGDKTTAKKLNLSDFLQPPISVYDPNAVWLSDYILIFRDKGKHLWKLSLLEPDGVTPYTKQKLFGNEIANKYNTGIVSPDAKYAAMFSFHQKEFRHSNLWRIDVYKITENSSSGYHQSLNDGHPVKVFQWAPMSYPSAFDAFDQTTKVQITDTGSEDIFNGISDWLYEEEILETDVAMYFSHSGTKLAYLSINDTLVKRINLEIYANNEAYPKISSIPYPKVGEVIPTATLWVYFANQSEKSGQKLSKLAMINPPDEVLKLKEFYFIRGNWLIRTKDSSETFIAVWSNRVQNVSFYSNCDVPNSFKGKTIQCKLDYYHTYGGNWLTPALTQVAFSTPKKYFTILPQKWTDGYTYAHLAYINYNSNSSSQTMARFVTSGPWEITEFVGYDPKNETAYFIAALPEPKARHLFSVQTNFDLPQNPSCLTCHMPKNVCNYVSAKFSPGAQFYTLTCNGPGVPKTYLRSAPSNSTSTIATLASNNNYTKYMSSKILPIVKYEKVDLGDGYVADIKLLLPPSIETAAAGETFPLILRVYAGPGSQLVLDNWAINFETFLVSHHNFIVAYVDGRGSGNKGSKYTSPLHHKLGTFEIEDQIAAVRILQNTTSYIKRDNVAVWGWSYGGFATAHIIKRDKFKTFKCAAAIAPVTDFLLYDAAYTERYMGLNYTTDNYDGYKRTNVNSDVSAFLSERFLLAHGTGDDFAVKLDNYEFDNVHFQNSAMLTEALLKKNVQFQFMAYPNQQHSISDNLLHLYTMLDTFFVTCFQTNKQTVDDAV